jgi:hypothetical protein
MGFNSTHNLQLTQNILEISRIYINRHHKPYATDEEKIAAMQGHWQHIHTGIQNLIPPGFPLKCLPLTNAIFQKPPMVI